MDSSLQNDYCKYTLFIWRPSGPYSTQGSGGQLQTISIYQWRFGTIWNFAVYRLSESRWAYSLNVGK